MVPNHWIQRTLGPSQYFRLNGCRGPNAAEPFRSAREAIGAL